MPQKKKRGKPITRRKKALFVFVALILFWLLIETVALVASSIYRNELTLPSDFQEMRDKIIAGAGGENSVVSRVHPYTGYVETPPETPGTDEEGNPVTFPVSDFGYIGSNSPLQKREDGKVILGILGGSVASYFWHYGTEQLEETLRQDDAFEDKEIVFLNLALGGYKQPQQLMTVAYLLSLGAEFDYLINLDGFNEVALHEAENAPKNVFPAFPRAWHTRVASTGSTETMRLRREILNLREQRANTAETFSGFPLGYSPTANLVWKVLDQPLRGKLGELEEKHRTANSEEGDYVVHGPPIYFESEDELYEFITDIWARSSLQLAKISRENDIGYFHFLQPNQYVRDSKPLSDEELRNAYLEDYVYRIGAERGYPYLRRKVDSIRQDDVTIVDLTMIFENVTDSIYIDTCCHINKLGNEMIAEEVGETILAHLDE